MGVGGWSPAGMPSNNKVLLVYFVPDKTRCLLGWLYGLELQAAVQLSLLGSAAGGITQDTMVPSFRVLVGSLGNKHAPAVVRFGLGCRSIEHGPHLFA